MWVAHRSDGVRSRPPMRHLLILLAIALSACASPPDGIAEEASLDSVLDGIATSLWLHGPRIDSARGLAPGEMEQAERALPRIAHRVPTPLSEVRRHYAGVVVEGRPAVLLRATGAASGVRLWYAIYDPERGAFVTLRETDDRDPRASASSPGALGERLLMAKACDTCHRMSPEASIDTDDAGGPDLWRWAGTARPLASGETVIADRAYFLTAVFDPAHQISRGYSDAMPSYRGQVDSLDVEAMWMALRCRSEAPPANVWCW